MTHLSRYSCEEAFRRLDDYLDRELAEGDRQLVEEHLAVCAACAREFTFEASVINSVRAKLASPAVPDTLRARVRALLDGERGGGAGQVD